MPTVPQSQIDPAQLEALSGGQYTPEPQHMLMAAADMHARGRLIEPQSQPGIKSSPPVRKLGRRRR